MKMIIINKLSTTNSQFTITFSLRELSPRLTSPPNVEELIELVITEIVMTDIVITDIVIIDIVVI